MFFLLFLFFLFFLVVPVVVVVVVVVVEKGCFLTRDKVEAVAKEEEESRWWVTRLLARVSTG